MALANYKHRKKQYMNNIIDNWSKSSSSLWKALDSICLKKNTKTNIVSLQICETTNYFNMYFSSLVKQYANEVNVTGNFTENIDNWNNIMYLKPISERDAISGINNLKNKRNTCLGRCKGRDNKTSKTT